MLLELRPNLLCSFEMYVKGGCGSWHLSSKRVPPRRLALGQLPRGAAPQDWAEEDCESVTTIEVAVTGPLGVADGALLSVCHVLCARRPGCTDRSSFECADSHVRAQGRRQLFRVQRAENVATAVTFTRTVKFKGCTWTERGVLGCD